MRWSFCSQATIGLLEKSRFGYNPQNLIHVGLRNWDGKGQTFLNELKTMPGIVSASIAGWNPREGTTSFTKNLNANAEGEKELKFNYLVVDFNFAHTLGLTLNSGRWLEAERPADHYNEERVMQVRSKEEYQAYVATVPSLVTTSTIKILENERSKHPDKAVEYPSAGVIRDFHKESLHHATTPLIILATENPNYAYLYVRAQTEQEAIAMQSLESVWKKFYPERLLNPAWLTDILDNQYKNEAQQQAVLTLFGILMLCIAALGVLGLVMQDVQQRVKEIGIRKVLGSKPSSIVLLLTQNYLKLLLVAFFIAAPGSWYFMSAWLDNFAYRTSMGWYNFAYAALLALTIVSLTAGWQALKAAMTNPVDSLRSE